MSSLIYLGETTPEQDERLLEAIRKVTENLENAPGTTTTDSQSTTDDKRTNEKE